MMSAFTATDASDELVQCLMTAGEEEETSIPLEGLQQKSQTEGASSFLTFSFAEDCTILSLDHCSRLCNFANFMWTKTSADFAGDRVDVRLVVPDDQFLDPLRPFDKDDDPSSSAAAALTKLRRAFASVPGARSENNAKIALRKTCGPTNACIDFYCDGDARMQPALHKSL